MGHIKAYEKAFVNGLKRILQKIMFLAEKHLTFPRGRAILYADIEKALMKTAGVEILQRADGRCESVSFCSKCPSLLSRSPKNDHQ